MLSVFSERSVFFRCPILWLLCLGLLTSHLGCGSGEDSTQQEEMNESSAREELVRKRQCSKNFSNIHAILRPVPENMNTELQSALSLLNQWYGSCAEWSDEKLSAEQPALKGVFTAEQISSLNQQTASLHDVLYLRDQLLMRAMMEHVVEDVPSDVEKIRKIFSYVQRNITHDPLLIDPRLYQFLQSRFPETVPQEKLSELSIPRTLQDIILSGRGSDDDLTWLFVALIRQLNIDAIMISPTQNPKAAGTPLPSLVLVPTGKKALLFCPAAGLEFRSGNSPEATGWFIEELAKDFSQVFASVSIDPSEDKTVLAALKQADWKSPRLSFPYGPFRVSVRSNALQIELAGNLACEVFEPLKTNPDEPGLIDRTAAVTGKLFPGVSVSLWNYPFQMYNKIVNASDSDNQLRNLYLATLNKTVQSIRTNIDQKENRTFTKSLVKRMQISRMNQVLGNETEAISSFMKIRLQRGIAGNASAEIEKENLLRSLQSEDAQYWSALCQFETGDYGTAARTLINYLQRYPQGRWQSSALELLADSQAKRQQFDSAIEVFEQVPMASPRRTRQLQKLKHWKEQAKK